ncbi:Hypothetical protein NGAL_HAMBI1145_24470 [Neorhizobium galegae bv. officinalis]|uniref:YcxB-like C-terminal domain-containing protein n=1 Tax=Neorhizobium galegae bv. officinalis TaxID=323656 RepID=A0A0T7FI26_NEOGA|nr:YcxB family protein [Neorhizobium galegae]CDZ34662.1 Hypothetical protein NGAL_HAMBI1145_24470 [Neorhizobium galegae bv. officinalis]
MQADRKFQITYTMTPWDYAAMTKAIARRPWQRGVLTTLLWLFSVWCLVALFTDTYDPVVMAQAILASRQSLFISAGLLVAVFTFSIFSHWFAWAISFLYYPQLASADATITMTLTDTAIEGNSSVGDTKTPWLTVKRVIRERDHLLLPISKREAFILPRRGFQSNADFDEASRYAAGQFLASRMAEPRGGGE